MVTRRPVFGAALAFLAALTLTVAVAQPALAHASKNTIPTYSGKVDPWTASAWYTVLFPTFFPATISAANDDWWDSTYANYTDVDESNWGIVITNGRQYPGNFTIDSNGYIVDSYGNWDTMPNNYPTCFVGTVDAYSCGDTQYHPAWSYYNTGNAYFETFGTIYTNDIYLDYYNWGDGCPPSGCQHAWWLSTF
jgi:hypothetical protein